jgi:ribosome biogenesis GTPase / thiamine phosphate phosphatase
MIIGITAMKTKRNEQNLFNLDMQNENQAPTERNVGTVIKVTTGYYTVLMNGSMLACTLAPALNNKDGKAGGRSKIKRDGKSNAPRSDEGNIVVGDRVHLAGGANGTGRIIAVQPRRNTLSRRSAVPMPSAYAPEQVIAANVDQVVPVFAAANPAPKWNMLDRYLALAESNDLPALIVITKLDLAQDAKGRLEAGLLSAVDEYRRLDYPVVLTSAVTGDGLVELSKKLRTGLSVLLGKSGVGKTALLNALQPGLGLRIREVSQATGKGKHTTTHSEIFSLDSGGAIIDTPGVREFGLWDMHGDELAYFYREMAPLVGACRFGLGCQHDEEPGCAIRRAVATGQISPHRYQSYLRLKKELGGS